MCLCLCLCVHVCVGGICGILLSRLQARMIEYNQIVCNEVIILK